MLKAIVHVHGQMTTTIRRRFEYTVWDHPTANNYLLARERMIHQIQKAYEETRKEPNSIDTLDRFTQREMVMVTTRPIVETKNLLIGKEGKGNVWFSLLTQ